MEQGRQERFSECSELAIYHVMGNISGSAQKSKNIPLVVAEECCLTSGRALLCEPTDPDFD